MVAARPSVCVVLLPLAAIATMMATTTESRTKHACME